ncbi:MAG: DUF4276 family protein [Candidatus Viridilinea halotolerans]|uniref:DUF4276 family protein n=1 Tax=Candidatus Viridilinea halotolerans TaxID=2491704 RepID=A0A426TQM5_9CHLR|nr:MAG: DUF4276 family protein [Candidatus Viridilinea halotolerans]
MNMLHYTLLTDGNSDRALLPIVTWALREQGVRRAIHAEWADLSRVLRRPRSLEARIAEALALYPCDLLCVHRDAERELPAKRRDEIATALAAVISNDTLLPPVVCIIPVRMQEAWLLFDVAAIRAAAGNPNGKQPLRLPDLARIEQMPDPKETLRRLLREASGLRGRRLQKFDDRPERVAAFMDDFAPLRTLSAFQRFEAELREIVVAQAWHHGL